jgi:protein O-GlcNAc transferase
MPLTLLLLLLAQSHPATDAMRHGRFAEAARLYEAELKTNPNQPLLRFNLGLALYSARNYQRALSTLQSFLKLQPSHPAANLIAASSLLKLKQPCPALDYLKRAEALSPSPEYLEPRAEAEAACGNHAAATPFWLALTGRQPANPRAWYGLGMAYSASGDEAAAKQAFARLSALGPSPELTRLERDVARGLWSAGRFAEARPALERVLALGLRDPSLHYELADTIEKLNGPEPALPHYRAALRLDPTLIVAHAALGRALATLQQPAAAIPHLETAARANIDKSLWAALANAYRAVGRSADARAALAKAR